MSNIPKIVSMGIVAVFVIAVLAVIFVVGSVARSDGDPRQGRVYLNDWSTYKFCDGTTLVYASDNRYSTDVVPNSPECVR